MTLDDYHASRWIVEPLHLLDCCLVSNGAVAVIVTSAERARDLRQPPVYLLGFGQAAPGRQPARRARAGRAHGRRSARASWRCGMAGVALDGHRRARALRLLHVHRPRHARGLRLLREGRRRRVRRGRQARPRRLAADEHRRRPALVVLHVGLHAALGGRDPGARPGRRAPGRRARPRARQRQRRHAQLALDDGPRRRDGRARSSTPSKPVPVPDEASRPFFDGARRGVLLLRRCRDCGTFMSPTGGHRHAAAAPLRRAASPPSSSGRPASGRGHALQLRAHAPGVRPGLRGRGPVQHRRRRARRGRAHDDERRRLRERGAADRDAARGHVRAASPRKSPSPSSGGRRDRHGKPVPRRSSASWAAAR